MLVADAENEKKESRFIIDWMKKKAQVFLRQSCSAFLVRCCAKFGFTRLQKNHKIQNCFPDVWVGPGFFKAADIIGSESIDHAPKMWKLET